MQTALQQQQLSHLLDLDRADKARLQTGGLVLTNADHILHLLELDQPRKTGKEGGKC